MKNPVIDTVFLQKYFEECVKGECRDEQSRQILPIFKMTDQKSHNGTYVKFIFKLDEDKECRERYFNNIRGLKVADCVVVVKHNDQLYCFIIELKSGITKTNTNALQQILNTCTRLKELEQAYRNEMKDEKREMEREIQIIEANLRSFIYLKKTSVHLVSSLKQHGKQRGKNRYPVCTIMPKDLQGKNLKKAISFILEKTN